MECERHSVDRLTFQSDKADGNFQAYPLPDDRDRPHKLATGRSIRAPVNQVGSLVSTMLPRPAAGPLQHHLAGNSRRIEIDTGKKRVSLTHIQWIARVKERMLMSTPLII